VAGRVTLSYPLTVLRVNPDLVQGDLTIDVAASQADFIGI